MKRTARYLDLDDGAFKRFLAGLAVACLFMILLAWMGPTP